MPAKFWKRESESSMASMSGDREKYWPLIEKRYGEKMSYWFKQMEKVGGKKYPEQIAFLKENYGFNQAHANALVMYVRGSTTSQRVASLTDYVKDLPADQKKTVKAIIKVIKSKHPKLELVISWNQPMFKLGTDYVFGISVAKRHILIAPFRAQVIKKFEKQLVEYKVNKKTIEVPNDWNIDAALLNKLVKACLAEIKTDAKVKKTKKLAKKAPARRK